MKLAAKFSPVCLLIILFAATGCHKENLPAVEPSWKEVELMGDAKLILNAATDGQNLYCHGGYLTTIIDSLNEPHYISFLNYSLERNPVHSKYFMYFYENKKGFYINSYHQLQRTSGGRVYTFEVDSTLLTFSTENVTGNSKVAINDKAQVLVSGQTINDKFNCYLISFEDVGSGAIKTLPASIKKIALPPLLRAPSYIYSFGTNFFLYDDERAALHKIDSSGTIVATLPRCYSPKMFQYKGKLYIVTGSSILLSTDNGTTFPDGFNYNADLSDYYFRVLNEEIFVFKPYSGIGVFTFTSGGFEIKQVENKELNNVHITALTYFNKRVYASTTSGLYYLNRDDIKLSN
jgi:hypothetical protein